MKSLNDVVAGDLILVPCSTGGFNPKTFYIPAKVHRTNKTQVVVISRFDKEVKYKRDNGYEVGQSRDRWTTARRAKPYSIADDQSDALAAWRTRLSLENNAHRMIDALKVKELSDTQLDELLNLLTSFNQNQENQNATTK